MDLQASLGCGCGDELDDDLVADQGASLPVLADEGEEPVLDLVPLAGAGREMAGGDVVIGADVDPSGVARQIIDAVGDRAAQLLDQEVVRANPSGVPCGR